MTDLNKLWDLWKGGNQQLVLSLVKSQGLNLYDVLTEFWELAPFSKETTTKNLSISNEGVGLSWQKNTYVIIVYIEAFSDNYSDDTCYVVDSSYDLNDDWVEVCENIQKYNSLDEAFQAAFLHFIKLITDE